MIKNLQSVPVSNADKIIILKYKSKPHDRSYSTNHVADYIFEKAVLKTFTASLRPLPLFLVAKRGDMKTLVGSTSCQAGAICSHEFYQRFGGHNLKQLPTGAALRICVTAPVGLSQSQAS